jgi:dTDP-4-amino-4,6-dideoxygalactose transaminase
VTSIGTMSVAFFPYGRMFAARRDEYLAAMIEVMDRGAFILQKENVEFERQFADFMGLSGACGVANGTDALVIALRAMGIGPGDEVILPSHTYVATAASVHFVGATPVLVDCAPDHLIDPAAVAAAVTSRTRCVMPVHLNGRTARMDEIMEIASRHGVVVVEDAAQGVGSRFRGVSAGGFGNVGTYSFFPAKTLGCFGDGGAVTSPDPSVLSSLRHMADHGRTEDGSVSGWGLNSRLDNLQAAVLSVRLRELAAEIEVRRGFARQYHEGLGDIGELVLPPPPDDAGEHFDSYQNFEIEADGRDRLREFLAARKIGTLIQWGGKAVHQIPSLKFDCDLPRTEALFERCMLLPMNSLQTPTEVDQVISEIRAFYGRSR